MNGRPRASATLRPTTLLPLPGIPVRTMPSPSDIGGLPELSVEGMGHRRLHCVTDGRAEPGLEAAPTPPQHDAGASARRCPPRPCAPNQPRGAAPVDEVEHGKAGMKQACVYRRLVR